ncbi:sensor histidine kinase [Nocardioides sp.]|uniref:sensor histidine kinase n=1 Tax=Nocardioides sp. TaxID=35761 RepID=UPI002ED50585
MAGSALLALTSDHMVRPRVQALLSGWVTTMFLFSGLVAWWRRPASRFGPLLLVASAVWVLGTLQRSNQPVAYSVGHVIDMLPPAVFLHVFLAYPTGRLERRSERLLVVACYGVAVGLQLLKVLLGVNPDNVFALAEAQAAGNWVERVQLVCVGAMLVAGAGLLLVRRRRETRHDRRRRRPAALLVDAFGLALVMLAALYVFGLFGGPPFEAFRHLTFVALGLAPVAFLIGLLDARLARTDVGEFLIELRTDPARDLQPPLAKVMHDPSLQVAYWLPEYDGWADKDGRPLPLPGSDSGRAVRIIRRDASAVAALVFDPSLEDEHELLDAVEAAAGIALETARLRAELRAQVQELQGSRARVLEAGRRERQRLERDLHDGAQQRLVGLSLELGVLGRAEQTDPETRRRLARLKKEVVMSLEELRDVARGLHPAVLTGHGLPVALESLAARASVPVALDVEPSLGRLPESVEVAAFYVVSESLTNIDKHARARSAVVRLALLDGALVVETVDDGDGGADTELGTGLRGLADRVEALGGRLQVWSPKGSGTRLRAEIPCG